MPFARLTSQFEFPFPTPPWKIASEFSMTGVYPEPSSLHLRKLTDWGKAERTMIAYEAKRTKVPAE